MGAFLADTDPVADVGVPGRYHATLGEDWNAFHAFGGATMAVGVRAMADRVGGSGWRPLSARASFLKPMPCGGLTVDTEIIRDGRTVRQVEGTLYEDSSEEPALRLHGIWGLHAPDPVTGLGVEPPPVPDPSDPSLVPTIRPESGFASLPLHTHFEERRCPGWGEPGAFLGSNGHRDAAVWTRLRESTWTDGEIFEPSALVAIADRAPGPHLGQTLIDGTKPDVQPRPIVSLELGIRFVADPVDEWLLLHSTIVEAANRYMTTRSLIWDQDRQLVAIAEQIGRFASRVVPDNPTPTDTNTE